MGSDADGSHMPSKLRPWYTYAAKFVQTIRTKSPKIVIRHRLPPREDGIKVKVGTVMMLSGLIEVTVKVKPSLVKRTNAEEAVGMDEVKVTAEGPKYDAFVLEQDNHGLKQTLEINPLQDYEHLDKRLQFNIRQV